MANLETELLKEKHGPQPKLYLRYVDDIFAIFDNKQTCASFLEKLNSQHPNIKFTMEQSTGNLTFLDVEIQVNNNKFDTWIWRKPTNTGLTLNFYAVCPRFWKEGLIKCMLHRAKKLCSNNILFENEVNKLRKIFNNNGYPTTFFNRILDTFYQERKEKESESSINHKFAFKIPYLGKPSSSFFKNIRNLMKRKFEVEIYPIFKTTKVRNYFNIKNRTPWYLQSNVVYKYTCSRDVNVTYIGSSSRHLIVRAKEHLNENLSNKSSIRSHIKNCKSCSGNKSKLNSFKVIRNCNTPYETRIQEAMMIKKQNPNLNKQLYANGSSFLLNIY